MTRATRLAATAAAFWLASASHAAGRQADRKVQFVNVVVPPVMTAGERYGATVTVRNTGDVAWTPDVFRLAYHWATPRGEVVVFDGLRTTLPGTVVPGATVDLCAVILAPETSGSFSLQLDLVQEGVRWFSSFGPGNQHAQRVTVTEGARPDGAFPLQAFARLLAFLSVTVGHFFVVSAVLRRVDGSANDLDRHVFLTVLVGLGLLLTILHALSATIGIGFSSGLAAIVMLDGVLWLWTRRTGRSPDAEASASHRLPWLAAPGLAIMLALLFQWYAATSVSLRVTGTDAAHYHVPHAINLAHGASLFGFVATPHLYPMGTSVWAAWLLQPLAGPLLLDLMTLPAMVLLACSMGWLCRLATGEAGVVWGPWLVLVALSAPIVRVSLLPSADLLYAAAFVALVAQCFAIWRSRAVRAIDVVALASAAGLLVGTKTTGLLSAVLIVATLGAMVLARRLFGPGTSRGLAWSSALLLPVAVATLVFTGAGGIWLIRNWIYFDSPLAPSGLTLAGWRIFPGEAYLAGGYYNSVLKDLTDGSGYDLWGRFALYARRLIGSWFVPAALALGVLAADVLVQWRRRRSLDELTSAKLALVFAVFLLAVTHVAALIPAPWTSLEWTRGLALRYVLPVLLLYIAAMGFSLFPSSHLTGQVPPSSRAVVSLAVMALITAHYINRQAVPDLPSAEWFPVLEWKWIAAASAIVSAFVMAGRQSPLARRAGLALVVVVGLVSSARIATDHQMLMAQAAQATSPSAPCGADTAVPQDKDNEYRCPYLRVLAFERSNGVASREPRRFFVVSRFDAPMDLQGPGLENLVFDVRGRTELMSRLRSSGPGMGERDYIVIDAREKDATGSQRRAYRDAVRSGLDLLGTCGRYEVYRARPSPR